MKKQVITFLMLIATVFTVNAQKTVSGVKVDAKLNLENQLQALKNSKKTEFPWLANTFTIE